MIFVPWKICFRLNGFTCNLKISQEVVLLIFQSVYNCCIKVNSINLYITFIIKIRKEAMLNIWKKYTAVTLTCSTRNFNFFANEARDNAALVFRICYLKIGITNEYCKFVLLISKYFVHYLNLSLQYKLDKYFIIHSKCQSYDQKCQFRYQLKLKCT